MSEHSHRNASRGKAQAIRSAPPLVVGGESDARRFVDALQERSASNDKELFVVEGATHVDLYDVPRHVEAAVVNVSSEVGSLTKVGDPQSLLPFPAAARSPRRRFRTAHRTRSCTRSRT
jgi:hypothetical protein